MVWYGTQSHIHNLDLDHRSNIPICDEIPCSALDAWWFNVAGKTKATFIMFIYVFFVNGSQLANMKKYITNMSLP